MGNMTENGTPLSSRRRFIKGMATLSALGVMNCGAAEPSKEKPKKKLSSIEKYNAAVVPKPVGLLEGEPSLQVPAPDSMGVVFAVTGLATGFVEVADNPELKNPRKFSTEGFPYAGIDDKLMRVRLSGLKPGTRYWYRAGASKMTYPLGYWTKPSEPQWGAVHSFITPGDNAPSHFGMMCDTHAQYTQMSRITKLYRELGVPIVVWNGDVPSSQMRTREDIMQNYLLPPENSGFAADTPILFNSGNHDYRGPYAGKLSEVMLTRLPTERKPRDLALERNFAIRMGEIALIGLDTGEDKPDQHPAHGGLTQFTAYRKAQTEWLKDQFLRPEIASAPYVVAFAHIPLIELWPNANPGTLMTGFAAWQKECADLWGPVLTANRVQLVMASHIHRYRFDPATESRSWAEITGGGRSENRQTLVEGKVENGELVVRVHNTDLGKIIGQHCFKPRV